MSVTFVLGETNVELPDPSPGYPVRAIQRQAVGRSAGGTLYVYDKGVETYEVEITFESLTDSEKSALQGFFDNDTEGCLNTFTYTDSNGTARTARFLEPRLEFIKISAGVWDVRIRLELNSMGT